VEITQRTGARVRTIDLNRITVFARVVESGSFTAAATALGLRKSSVSRNVAALEADLGIRLLQRTTRKLSLTDAGRAASSPRGPDGRHLAESLPAR
jgi:molybdenum-dependent DNA-binding transcriptional regulator ModE